MNSQIARGAVKRAPTRKTYPGAATLVAALDVAREALLDAADVQDRLVVVDVSADSARAQVGVRTHLLARLVADGIVDPHLQHFLSRPAAIGWAWALVRLGGHVSAVLMTIDRPEPEHRNP